MLGGQYAVVCVCPTLAGPICSNPQEQLTFKAGNGRSSQRSAGSGSMLPFCEQGGVSSSGLQISAAVLHSSLHSICV